MITIISSTFQVAYDFTIVNSETDFVNAIK